MVYNYKELDVFNEARKTTNKIYELSRQSEFSKDFALVNQIRRSAISVMSNIAEGSGRGTRKENANFLNIAKGSCCELQAQIIIACDQGYISQEEYDALDDDCDHIIRMLIKLINYMKYGKKEDE